MPEQLSLAELPDVDEATAFALRSPVRISRATQFDEEAFDFLVDHPDIWSRFVAFVHARVSAGATRIGAKRVIEDMRDEFTSAHGRPRAPREWALNNSHTTSIALIYVEAYPEHRHLFHFRDRPSETRRAREAA